MDCSSGAAEAAPRSPARSARRVLVVSRIELAVRVAIMLDMVVKPEA
ncbi:MAG TPA: hypothetical protein VGL21_09740 [Jatrophihabitantaceae bacterium]